MANINGNNINPHRSDTDQSLEAQSRVKNGDFAQYSPAEIAANQAATQASSDAIDKMLQGRKTRAKGDHPGQLY